MAVLKWRYAMVFYLITQFLCGSSGEEKKEKIEKLLRLQQGMVTGYPVLQNPYDRQSLICRSVENLQKLIDNLYDQLECGYFYSALLHIESARDVLVGNAENAVVTAEMRRDLSFDVEAAMMIDSFPDMSLDVLFDLWSLLIYGRRMRILFHVINNDKAYVAERVKLNDDEILSVIGKYIENKRCAPDNRFNTMSKTEKLHSSAAGENPQPIVTIRTNKQLLHKTFIENRVNRTSESLSRGGSLWLFRDCMAFKSFFDKFLAAHSDRFEAQFPALDSENNLTGIDSLGVYQSRVIGTLQIITLQVILSYTNRLTYHAATDAHNFYYDILTKLQYLLPLEDDADFKGIIDNYLGNVHNSMLCDSIVEMIKKIQTKNNLPEIKSIVTDSDKTMKDIFNVGISFVETIQKEIGEMSIRAVLTFLKVTKKIDTLSFYNM